MELHTSSDVEMDSEMSHDARPGLEMTDSPTPEAPRILTPPIPVAMEAMSLEPLELNTTPRKSRGDKTHTPRQSMTLVDQGTTPRPRPDETTPRAVRTAAPTSKRGDSMPPRAVAPTSLGPTAPGPVKAGRNRKGMSLDKFGIAKLLGQTIPEQDSKAAPPSSFSRSTHSKRGSMSRPPADEGHQTDKKSRRKTLQLMVNRSNSIKGHKSTSPVPSTPATPLSPIDINPPSGVKAQPSPPVVQHPNTQSTASIATADGQNSPIEPKNASSNAAKKVMDWFRRKSMARDTLSGLKTAGPRSDSTSSFVRVSDSPVRSAPSAQAKLATDQAMSSTTSFPRATENTPAITISETGPSPEPAASVPRREPETIAAPAPVAALSQADTAMVSSTSLVSPARETMPARSKSHHPDSLSPMPTSTTMTPAMVALRPSATSVRNEENKMRVHTGLVDQSALSSRPPKEVIDEVLKVLQDMGMEVKRENEYRFRCTRVRRKKAGATTSLGLGSVMSYGSGISPLAMMSSSISKVSPFRLRE
jgi:protein-serine/threonine kinase